MKLHKVITMVQFKHTYWIEAKELEHAFDEVVMRDALTTDDERYFEESAQEYLGEVIIDGETLPPEAFDKWLAAERQKKESWVSHWMGTKLIHTIDYSDDVEDSPVMSSMANSLMAGTPRVE